MSDEKVITQLHDVLHEIVSGLENSGIIETAFTGYGWNYSAITKSSLIRYINSFSEYLVYVEKKPMNSQLNVVLDEALESFQSFSANSLPQVLANHAQIVHLVSSLVELIEITKTNIVDAIKTSPIEDQLAELKTTVTALHTQMRTFKNVYGNDSVELNDRLSESRAKIDHVYEKAEDLTKQVSVIEKASEQVADLPEIVFEFERQSENLRKQHVRFNEEFKNTEANIHKFTDNVTLSSSYADEIFGLVAECKRSRNIVVAEGLAAGFEEKEAKLKVTILWWVTALVCALIMGMTFGYFRAEELNKILETEPTLGQSLLHFLITIFSVGGPFWLAWLSTRQINKCFTLSEDYAYKATVTRAYTGFQDEANKFNKETAHEIFKSTIARLDEMPLRLVDNKDYSTPWQELLNSDVIKAAGPEVMLEIVKAAAGNNKSKVSKVVNSLMKVKSNNTNSVSEINAAPSSNSSN